MNEFSYGQKISDETLAKWQKIIDLIAKVVDVPIGCITRLIENDFSLIITNEDPQNPFEAGYIGCLQGSKLYCEKVLNENKMTLVGNALEDSHWEGNPEVDMGIISYLGFPITWPDGKPFGTFCVLDIKENYYSEVVEELMSSLVEIIRADLELMYMNAILGEGYTSFQDCLEEIKSLREELENPQS